MQTTYETLMLMLTFGMLLIALREQLVALTFIKKD